MQDPAATALAAELLLQGPDVWPFDSDKQALMISAIAAVLPGISPGAIAITGVGAPFRRRLLQVSMRRQHSLPNSPPRPPVRPADFFIPV